MHETCLCCNSELEQMGDPAATADGNHVVRRFKCNGCQRGGSRYRKSTGEIVGCVGPVFRSDYMIDSRRQPTAAVDHSKVATDGGEKR